MRYSTEPKTASKWVVQKTAEATADLIGKKITDQITSIGKPKEKEKTKEVDENLYPTRKKATNYWWLQIVLSINFLFLCIKMKFQKIVNFLGTTSDDNDLPRFFTKKWIEVYDHSEGNYNRNKEIRIKKSILRSDLCDYFDAYIVVKGDTIVTKNIYF